MGGKSRISRGLASAIAGHTDIRRCWEPFCGGASMTAALVSAGFTVYATDNHPGLAAMWAEAQRGWVPPESVTAEEYRALKSAPESHLRTFVGFGCSFGGKWWGGYAKNARGDNFARAASRGIVRKVRAIGTGGTFRQSGFFDQEPRHMEAVIYADPPYAGATGYSSDFDSQAFWDACRAWRRAGVPVYVSEYRCPVPAEVVWQRMKAVTLGLGAEKVRTERLFLVAP